MEKHSRANGRTVVLGKWSKQAHLVPAKLIEMYKKNATPAAIVAVDKKSASAAISTIVAGSLLKIIDEYEPSKK